jgi:hypothetical protein
VEYFEAPDGHGEPCLWSGDQQSAEFVTRKRDITAKFWPDVVARMTGTTIQADDATVTVVEQAIFAHEWFTLPADLDDDQRDAAKVYAPTARAILAALTGGAT